MAQRKRAAGALALALTLALANWILLSSIKVPGGPPPSIQPLSQPSQQAPGAGAPAQLGGLPLPAPSLPALPVPFLALPVLPVSLLEVPVLVPRLPTRLPQPYLELSLNLSLGGSIPGIGIQASSGAGGVFPGGGSGGSGVGGGGRGSASGGGGAGGAAQPVGEPSEQTSREAGTQPGESRGSGAGPGEQPSVQLVVQLSPLLLYVLVVAAALVAALLVSYAAVAVVKKARARRGRKEERKRAPPPQPPKAPEEARRPQPLRASPMVAWVGKLLKLGIPEDLPPIWAPGEPLPVELAPGARLEVKPVAIVGEGFVVFPAQGCYELRAELEGDSERVLVKVVDYTEEASWLVAANFGADPEKTVRELAAAAVSSGRAESSATARAVRLFEDALYGERGMRRREFEEFLRGLKSALKDVRVVPCERAGPLP